ncbi:hypothetical protein VCHA48O428_40347 [Vibrio chagasii]|nr:hypothetical protein VCHA48O428_40347 [Vibrio chagasii]
MSDETILTIKGSELREVSSEDFELQAIGFGESDDGNGLDNFRFNVYSSETVDRVALELKQNIDTVEYEYQQADLIISQVVDKNNADSLSRDTSLSLRIAQEVHDRQESFSYLRLELDQEITDRQDADTAINLRIDNLESDTSDGFDTLSQRIALETQNRITADAILQGNIDSEEQARIAADLALGQRIDTTNENLAQEIEDRTDADDALGLRIDTTNENLAQEVQDRIDADNALGGRIDDVEDDLSQESLARIAGDEALGIRIDDVESDLAKESLARIAGDEALGQRIDGVRSDLSQETEDRIAADDQLQENIDTNATEIARLESSKEDNIPYGQAGYMTIVNDTGDGFEFIPQPSYDFIQMRGTLSEYTDGVDPTIIGVVAADPLNDFLYKDVPPNIPTTSNEDERLSPNGYTYIAQENFDAEISDGDGEVNITSGDFIIWSGDRWSHIPVEVGTGVDGLNNLTGMITLAGTDGITVTTNSSNGTITVTVDASVARTSELNALIARVTQNEADIESVTTELNSHSSNTTVHITSAERAAWNSKAEGEHEHEWDDLVDPPAQATRWPTHDEVTGKPDTATRWPTHDEVTNKPDQAVRWPAATEVTAGTFGTGVLIPWANVEGAPAQATRWPTAAEVTAGTFGTDVVMPWANIDSPPAQATRWPTHDEVTGKPDTATRWPTYDEVTGKPTTYPPSSHSHPWDQVTEKPAEATRWPAASEIGVGEFPADVTIPGAQVNGTVGSATTATNQSGGSVNATTGAFSGAVTIQEPEASNNPTTRSWVEQAIEDAPGGLPEANIVTTDFTAEFRESYLINAESVVATLPTGVVGMIVYLGDYANHFSADTPCLVRSDSLIEGSDDDYPLTIPSMKITMQYVDDNTGWRVMDGYEIGSVAKDTLVGRGSIVETGQLGHVKYEIFEDGTIHQFGVVLAESALVTMPVATPWNNFENVNLSSNRQGTATAGVLTTEVHTNGPNIYLRAKLDGNAVTDVVLGFDAWEYGSGDIVKELGGTAVFSSAGNILGSIQSYNASMTTLPTGNVWADGQLLSRDLYPELFGWANSFGQVVTEAEWQALLAASPNGTVNVYSSGTTADNFRVPLLKPKVDRGSIVATGRGGTDNLVQYTVWEDETIEQRAVFHCSTNDRIMFDLAIPISKDGSHIDAQAYTTGNIQAYLNQPSDGAAIELSVRTNSNDSLTTGYVWVETITYGSGAVQAPERLAIVARHMVPHGTDDDSDHNWTGENHFGGVTTVPEPSESRSAAQAGLIPNPNLLINGDFVINQRAIGVGGDETFNQGFFVDRWFVNSNMGGTTLVRSDQRNNTGMYTRFTHTGLTQGAFVGSRIEVTDWRSLIDTTMSIEVNHSQDCTMRAILFIRRLNDHEVLTQLDGEFIPVESGQRWVYATMSGLDVSVVGADECYCEIRWVYNGGDGIPTPDGQYRFYNSKFESGNVPTLFVPDDFQTNLAKCQRYYESSYRWQIGEKEGHNFNSNVTSALTNGAYIWRAQEAGWVGSTGVSIFKNPKRVPPTLRVYDTVGEQNRATALGVSTGNAPEAGTLFGAPRENGWVVDVRMASGDLTYGYHWAADAEL